MFLLILMYIFINIFINCWNCLRCLDKGIIKFISLIGFLLFFGRVIGCRIFNEWISCIVINLFVDGFLKYSL